jgi:hypothetical protein
VRASVPELRECYEEWLKVSPGLGGKISIRFRIVPSKDDPAIGRVVEVHLGGDGGLGNVAMEGCILSVMEDLAFERPSAPVDVTYPLTFSGSDRDAG